MAVRRSSHAVYELEYHFVWAIKYRKKVFNTREMKTKVEEIFREIAAQYDLTIEEIKAMSDHVHLLVSSPPRFSPARIANILKSVSMRLIFRQYSKLKKLHFWGGELWVGGYCVKSSGHDLTTVQIQHYIQTQDQPVLL